jgi:hypothetical protein
MILALFLLMSGMNGEAFLTVDTVTRTDGQRSPPPEIDGSAASLTQGQHLTAAEPFAAGEIPANLRALLIDGAMQRQAIERDAGAVAPLVHAADSGMFDDQLFRDLEVARLDLDDHITAFRADGAGRKIEVGGNQGITVIHESPSDAMLGLADHESRLSRKGNVTRAAGN